MALTCRVIPCPKAYGEGQAAAPQLGRGSVGLRLRGSGRGEVTQGGMAVGGGVEMGMGSGPRSICAPSSVLSFCDSVCR